MRPIEPEMSWELLLFEVDGRQLSLPIGAVREVLRVVTIVESLEGDSGLEGVINRRGEVVPVVDLRAWLGLPPVPPEPDHQLILVESEGTLVALRVDRVLELVGRGRSGETSETGKDPAGMARRPEGLVAILDPSRFSSLARAADARARTRGSDRTAGGAAGGDVS